jgi:hypothetical protein
MSTQGLVHIAAAADGEAIAQAIRQRLAGQATIPDGACPSTLPPAHERAVLVFVLTEQALADPAVRHYAALAAGSRFPMLPVPPERGRFAFSSLKGEFEALGRLNAVAWDDGETPGALVSQAIRRHLGLEPFKRDCRLFISYRRSDGLQAAHALYDHFRSLGFDAFLDTEDEAIEPGEEFQPRIHEAIPEKDFLLIVDSPDAADSSWVREEVSVALANRVAILTVRVGGSQGFPQVRDMPAVEWGPNQERNLFEVERAVRAQIAARRSFDRRVQQTLEGLKPLQPFTSVELKKRRLLLTLLGEESGPRRCLLEYEDAAYSLSRLHRLSMGRQEAGLASAEEGAVLIHQGRRLSAEEQAALDWARHEEPLQVLALDQVASYFLLPGSPA